MLNKLENKTDIYLLGSGIKSFYQLTFETQQIIKECNELYYLHQMPSLDLFLKKMHKKPINLIDRFYKDGRIRTEIYNEISDFIIERGKEISGVAFLMHGHPVVASSLTQYILEKGKKEDLIVKSLPGISALDCIYAELGFDVLSNGTQLLETGALVEKNIKLNPKLDTVLFQIASFRSNKAERKKSHSAKDLMPLKEYLLKIYPKNHEVSIIECAVEIGTETTIHKCKLSELDTLDISIFYNQSMFIPAIII